MFGPRKRLRRLAACTLLVWLFALTTGIVNACVVEPDLRHVALSAQHEPRDATPAHPHEHAAATVGHEHQTPQGDTPACAKFCDDESASVPTVKQQTDLLNAVWLATPPTGSLAVQATHESVGGYRAESRLLHARIPIPIAFLRLTL